MAQRVLDFCNDSLCCVEGNNIFKKNSVNIAHLPTLMLVIGYPIYWAEMLSSGARTGVTSPAATILFVAFTVFILFRERQPIADGLGEYQRWFLALDLTTRLFVSGILSLIFGILLISFFASLLPIHLLQEGDALNYHYSLTRQHLIIGSFAHIPWSAFDLFLLPVDYALAPFWFVTQLPNKIPQFIFFVGLVLVCLNLIRYLKGGVTASCLLAVAFLFGSHGHGIQFGTAMLDLANCYLLLAMFDSFIRRAHWLFIIEANFYFWAKPFVPLQSAAVILTMCLIIVVLKAVAFKDVCFDFQKLLDRKFFNETWAFLKRCAIGFILISVAVAGPFIAKSIYYAGTPLYPFVPGVITHHQIPEGTVAWSSLVAASDYWLHVTRNGYGYGRSVMDFINHFWLIAIPSHGVNNEFDYPLGLSYLIALGPFIILMWKSLKERRIVLLPWLVIIFWVSWFAGSQQSRWLYVPILLMFLTVSVKTLKPSKILLSVLTLALILNLISLSRAHVSDFMKSRQMVLRDKDKALVDLSVRYIQNSRVGYVQIDNPEVTYAQFPVVIREESLPNVVAF